jgi:cytidylate kinase
MQRADDAREIDTTNMEVDAVVDLIEQLVHAARRAA